VAFKGDWIARMFGAQLFVGLDMSRLSTVGTFSRRSSGLLDRWRGCSRWRSCVSWFNC